MSEKTAQAVRDWGRVDVTVHAVQCGGHFLDYDWEGGDLSELRIDDYDRFVDMLSPTQQAELKAALLRKEIR